MKGHVKTQLILVICLVCNVLAAQKINGEIFIPMNNRSEIWLKPRIDTLDNGKEYQFKIRVAPEYTISQFLFEKGLAINNDSVLIITPRCNNFGGIDTATLRVVVTSITGSRIMLFQKPFIVRVPEKMFPIISHPKTNIVMVNDNTMLDRNESYSKALFISSGTYMTVYDNERNMQKLDVKGVTVALFEKEGKQYVSTGDTLSNEAIKELKRIRKPTPVYIRVDAQDGKRKKTVWNRIIVDAN
jgi:hypothetical protein